MENTVFESRLQSVSRNDVLAVTMLLMIPVFLMIKSIAPWVFANLIPCLLLVLALLALFAVGYLRGFWSSKRVKIIKNGDFYKIEETGNGGLLANFNKLKLAGYGWIYEDFSSVITHDVAEEDFIGGQKPKLARKTSNLMVVVQLKSPTVSVFLLESISPWRSTPNQLPYFHQPNIDKVNVCYYVKGLEKMIANLKLNIS
jgi:hypothetical protein